MGFNKVQISGINTSNIPTIPEAKKQELLKRAHKGDKSARNKLITSNLKLVLSVIQKFLNRGESADDLFQIGCIGLIKAIDNFDISQNVRFSTYAVPMIIGEIRRYLRDNNAIRASRSLKDIAYKVILAKENMSSNNNREPTIEEISKEINASVENIVIALESVAQPISMNEPVFNDGNSNENSILMDHIGDKDDDSSWIDEIQLKDSIKKLSRREKEILGLRFIQGMTQMDVAKKIGISQAQVSRLERMALIKVRN